MVDNVAAKTSKVSIKQEPGVVGNAAAATVPKLTIKSESLERTVVAQTLSTTCVHVSDSIAEVTEKNCLKLLVMMKLIKVDIGTCALAHSDFKNNWPSVLSFCSEAHRRFISFPIFPSFCSSCR